jgi:hypothetical protein
MTPLTTLTISLTVFASPGFTFDSPLITLESRFLTWPFFTFVTLQGKIMELVIGGATIIAVLAAVPVARAQGKVSEVKVTAGDSTEYLADIFFLKRRQQIPWWPGQWIPHLPWQRGQ